eukprot:TRINITY_DN62893_c0_g1_i1.p1 TRINITY_DN62893_c0_g1~~TRINITY_DN62893_c0_g1_i1.p1  ORF type:complete len:349 (-),score=109.62 TRINITY_DN62893_c0_g1_i1:40-1041(-)
MAVTDDGRAKRKRPSAAEEEAADDVVEEEEEDEEARRQRRRAEKRRLREEAAKAAERAAEEPEEAEPAGRPDGDAARSDESGSDDASEKERKLAVRAERERSLRMLDEVLARENDGDHSDLEGLGEAGGEPAEARGSIRKADTMESRKVFVASLPWAATAEEVEAYFEKCGEIDNFNMPMHKQTGQPMGIAFIIFANQDGVANAVKLHGSRYGSQKLRVSVADPEETCKWKLKHKGSGDASAGRGSGRGWGSAASASAAGSESSGRGSGAQASGRGSGASSGGGRGRGWAPTAPAEEAADVGASTAWSGGGGRGGRGPPIAARGRGRGRGYPG